MLFWILREHKQANAGPDKSKTALPKTCSKPASHGLLTTSINAKDDRNAKSGYGTIILHLAHYDRDIFKIGSAKYFFGHAQHAIFSLGSFLQMLYMCHGWHNCRRIDSVLVCECIASGLSRYPACSLELIFISNGENLTFLCYLPYFQLCVLSFLVVIA